MSKDANTAPIVTLNGQEEIPPAVPRLGRGKIKGYKHPLDQNFERAGWVKSKPPPPPEDRMVITIWPQQSYFIWHPAGPTHSATMCGYHIVDGRIPGAVPGTVAELMKAYGCRVEDYVPGMDIADWNPVETGGYEPRFTTDKPDLAVTAKANDSKAIDEKQPDLAVTDSEPKDEPPAPPEVVEVVEDKPVNYSLLDKDSLKKLCDERGLTADKRSVVSMLEALEASD